MTRKKGKGTHRESLPSPGAEGPAETDDFRPSNPDAAPLVDPEDVRVPARRGREATGVKATRVRVRATRTGYYGHRRRRTDDVFDMYVKDAGKLPSWVEEADRKEKLEAEGMSLNLEEEGTPGFVSVARPRVPDRSNFEVEVV